MTIRWWWVELERLDGTQSHEAFRAPTKRRALRAAIRRNVEERPHLPLIRGCRRIRRLARV
jgi:hypothetical protein